MPAADGLRAPRRRRPASEIRAILLQTGTATVLREGLALDVANLGFEEVIRTAAVPRTTAYRLWPHRAAYLVDLLDALFGEDGSAEPVRGFDEETFATVARLLEERRESMSTPEGRAEVLREAARQGIARNLAAVASSIPWRAYRSAVSAANSGVYLAEEENVLRRGLQRIESRFLARMAAAFDDLAAAFGRTFVPGVTAYDLALVTASIVEGIVERRQLLDAPLGDTRAVRLDGGSAHEWNLAALACYAQFVLLTTEHPPT